MTEDWYRSIRQYRSDQDRQTSAMCLRAQSEPTAAVPACWVQQPKRHLSAGDHHLLLSHFQVLKSRRARTRLSILPHWLRLWTAVAPRSWILSRPATVGAKRIAVRRYSSVGKDNPGFWRRSSLRCPARSGAAASAASTSGTPSTPCGPPPYLSHAYARGSSRRPRSSFWSGSRPLQRKRFSEK